MGYVFYIHSLRLLFQSGLNREQPACLLSSGDKAHVLPSADHAKSKSARRAGGEEFGARTRLKARHMRVRRSRFDLTNAARILPATLVSMPKIVKTRFSPAPSVTGAICNSFSRSWAFRSHYRRQNLPSGRATAHHRAIVWLVSVAYRRTRGFRR